MSNLGSNLAKIGLLAGGAVLGAWLSRIFDEALLKRAEVRSEHDRIHYEQGLKAVEPVQPNTNPVSPSEP